MFGDDIKRVGFLLQVTNNQYNLPIKIAIDSVSLKIHGAQHLVVGWQSPLLHIY